MKRLHLISGLPRSGSTLLCNLLNMNPEFHATATSYTIDVIRNIRTTISNNVTAKTHNRLDEMENIRQGMLGFLNGYYYDKNIVFDKCRGWVGNIDLMDNILGHKETKIIWTYRNPVEIVSSIEKRHQETMLLENMDESAGLDFSTLISRVENFIGPNGIVGRPMTLLNDAIIRGGYEDRIMIIKYWDLTNNTQETMNRIHNFLNEKKYDYAKNNFSDLKQTTYEYDGFYNYKFMHTIKEGSLEFKSHNVILNQEIIKIINERFEWLNNFVHGQINN